MILIITSKRDGHIDLVAQHLNERRVNWVRLNTDDFATNIDITVHPDVGDGTIDVKDSGRKFMLSDVKAVWYRKPDPVRLDHMDMTGPAMDYVEAEFTEILMGLYALLKDAFWINDPFSTRIAHRKLLQLRTATEVGFSVPRSVLTNNASDAIAFSSAMDADLALKSIGAICVHEAHRSHVEQYGIFTRRITHEQLLSSKDNIANMPTMLQEFLPKRSELRITCVGDYLFPCEIATRDDDITAVDYRFDTTNLHHRAIDVDPDLAASMNAYMKALNLNFAAFDFIVPEEGRPIFLEANCNGQWAWVEKMTGLEIGAAIADTLIRASRTTNNVLPDCTSRGKISEQDYSTGDCDLGSLSKSK